MNTFNLELVKLDMDLTICKMESLKDFDFGNNFFFIAKTDEEISVVCETKNVPNNTTIRDNDWCGFKVQGILDFSLIGVLSYISSILAENKISIFAVSTYNTDYILVKKQNFEKAVKVLQEANVTVS